MTDLVIRPLRPGEEHLFLAMSVAPLAGVAAVLGRDFRATLARREYRPEWTWVALRDDTVLARAAWWGGPGDTEPIALDWFDAADPDAGERLLRAASPRTEFCLLLPEGWREQPDVRREAEQRIDIAVRAGMRPLVERLHYTWTPAAGLPDPPGRLTLRPEPDDAVVLDVLRRVHSVTLDAHALRTIAERGLDAAAQDELTFLHWMPSPRDWCRLGYTASGDLAGITIPGRNYTDPIIGFVGVVPEQRGRGFGYDLLVEATRMLAAGGAERITAETDATNTPMAKAFARAHYPVTQERVYLAPGPAGAS